MLLSKSGAVPRDLFVLIFLVLLILPGGRAIAQQAPGESTYYARRNSFGVFGAYSSDSSHILLGDAERRKLVDIGGSYGRRLVLNNTVNWMYSAEVLPVALESDPLSANVNHQTAPTNATYMYTLPFAPVTCAVTTTPYSVTNPETGVTYTGTGTSYCHGRQWTIGEAISPFGMQWNFLPRRRLQPFAIGHGGYMYSTRAIPVDGAGSFNFTFDGGMGLEWYRTRTQSMRAEYRYHHISNDDTANANPGIDSGVLQVTYSWGR